MHCKICQNDRFGIAIARYPMSAIECSKPQTMKPTIANSTAAIPCRLSFAFL